MDHPLDHTTAALLGLGIFALLAIAFFAVFRGEGALSIKTIFGRFDAKGKNPAPPTAVAAGVRMEDAEAARDIRAHAEGVGGVDLKRLKAGGEIDASSTPGAPPPKP